MLFSIVNHWLSNMFLENIPLLFGIIPPCALSEGEAPKDSKHRAEIHPAVSFPMKPLLRSILGRNANRNMQSAVTVVAPSERGDIFHLIGTV